MTCSYNQNIERWLPAIIIKHYPPHLLLEKKDPAILKKLSLIHAQFEEIGKTDTASKMKISKQFVANAINNFVEKTISILHDLQKEIKEEADCLFGGKQRETCLIEKINLPFREDSEQIVNPLE